MVNAKLLEYVTYKGPCFWDADGWQIAFNFGDVQASLLKNSNTDGVELTVWGLEREPKRLHRVTPMMAADLLNLIMVVVEARGAA